MPVAVKRREEEEEEEVHRVKVRTHTWNVIPPKTSTTNPTERYAV